MMTGAALCCLMTLSGCSGTAQPTAEPVRFLPPVMLLDDCPLPPRDGAKTVGDLVRIVIADENAIKAHNVNMQALREYRAKMLKLEGNHGKGN